MAQGELEKLVSDPNKPSNDARGGGKLKLKNEKFIKERKAQWENGDNGTLRNNLILPNATKKARETSSQNENRMLERARTLCHQGFFKPTKTYKNLCSLHPKEKVPFLPVKDELCLGSQFSERVVGGMLSSFPKGTAAGPSMMYAEHLSNAVRCNNPEKSRVTMQKLTSLMKFCSSSGFPNDVGQTLCNYSEAALKKKKTGVRSIAVGKNFRRLGANCLVSYTKEEVLEILETKLIDEECGESKSLGVLQIEFENAFNSIKGQGVLSERLKQIPCLYRFVSSCYAKHSSLLYNGQAINSESGVQQVDTLKPLFDFPGSHTSH